MIGSQQGERHRAEHLGWFSLTNVSSIVITALWLFFLLDG